LRIQKHVLTAGGNNLCLFSQVQIKDAQILLNKSSMRHITPAFAAVATLAAVASAQAQFTEISIASQANANLQTYSFGANYAVGGTTFDVADVPFTLATDGGVAGTTGAVQTPGNTPFGSITSWTFSVPAGTHATELFSLANLAFGAAGYDEGSIVVTGTGGETATLTLNSGVNIRDHNEDGFINTLSDATVVPTYFQGGSIVSSSVSIQTRLDRQELILPSDFAGDTIASITFNGIDNAGDGEAFLAGLTLSDAPVNVPEVPSMAVLGLAACALVAARRFLPASA
jgi:hypothetical protein